MDVRLYLEYADGSVQLPAGETTIGRDVDCGLRFNDPYLSRRHARIRLGPGGAFVEELSSRNGTFVNGMPIRGRQRLEHGDTLELGKRSLSIVYVEEESSEAPQEATRPDARDAIRDLVGDLAAIEAGDAELPGPSQTLPAPPPARTCPQCRARVPAARGRCDDCGYDFPLGGPASATQRIELRDAESSAGALDRRTEPRRPLSVPVVYTSETMTIDATTSDLSRSGVFIPAQLLDDVGTRCQVTLLPEASPAIPIDGVVARVVSDGEPGMGIRFENPSERARRWLEAMVDRPD